MVIANPFWDRLARNYPSYDNPQMGQDVRVMIDAATDFGVRFENARVLDIGCGTGTVAIPLAQMGAQVSAMDISDEMLKRLRSDSTRAGVEERIDPYLSDWDGFEVADAYDVVIASMTPAVSGEAHYAKYIAAAKRWGIFVGWGDFKRNDFLKELATAHGGKYAEPRNRAGAFYERITGLGKRANITYFETRWEEEYPVNKAREYAVSHLERDGIAADPRIIDAVIDIWQKDGEVTVETHAQKGVVIWEA